MGRLGLEQLRYMEIYARCEDKAQRKSHVRYFVGTFYRKYPFNYYYEQLNVLFDMTVPFTFSRLNGSTLCRQYTTAALTTVASYIAYTCST